jgi:hypothetical protein
MATKTPSRAVKSRKPGQSSVNPQKKAKKSWDLYVILVLAAIVMVSLIRLRLAGIPLERDEGEYAYIGKLLLEGTAPYLSAYNMKLPGTYFMYSLIMLVFGKSFMGIHYGLLIMNACTMWILFLGFRRLFNSQVAIISSVMYGFFSLSPVVLGFAAHATHFINLFVAAGIYFMSLIPKSNNKYHVFLLGLMFGTSFLMKQQAVYFLFFGGAFVVYHYFPRNRTWAAFFKSTALYASGVILPYLITAGILYLAGAFEKFWFWTVEYASKYATGVTLEEGKQAFASTFDPIYKEYPLVWIFAGLGMILLFISKYTNLQKLIACSFILFAALSITPGLYFRQHYFITLLPAITLLSAIALNSISNFITEKVRFQSFAVLSIVFILFTVGSAFSNNKEYYLKMEAEEIGRMIYQGNPFDESQEIANYIKEHTRESDKIAILGSEPQILFYSGRHSATGYLYMYGLMENQPYNKSMQEEMIREIEREKPKFIIFCRIAFSWLPRNESPKRIFEWSDQYLRNYNLVGVTDILGGGLRSNFIWGKEALTYNPQGQNSILIMERK